MLKDAGRETFEISPEAVHSTCKTCKRAWKKVLCSAQKKYKDQAEFPGSTSWIMGSIAPSPSQRRPLIFDADLPQKRNSVFGTNKFMRYFRSIIAARESIPKRRLFH